MPKTHIRQNASPAAVVHSATQLGANISAARLRRGWTQDTLAGKAGITRPTLQRIEAGELGTGLGAYIAVLWAMGLHDSIATIASLENDAEGAALIAPRMGERARTSQRVDDDF